MKILRAAMVACVAAGCGLEAGPEIGHVEVEPASTLIVGIGDSVAFELSVFDDDGRETRARDPVWRSSLPEVASVSQSGVAMGVGAGVASIIVELDDVADTARLEVWVPRTVGEYVPEVSYFGREEYVEYIPGTLPLILSAPHGGALRPTEIPDRSWGTMVTDSRTIETLLATREAFLEHTGEAPHVVISYLERTKLDPNREIEEAAQDNPFAEQAWREFHAFLEIAAERVEADLGAGLYVDLHGHGHDILRLELGYLLTAAQLNQADDALDAANLEGSTSVAAVAASSPLTLSALIRGPESLGAYLAREGVPAVPSPDDPHPGGDPYFSGGYNTARHGSREGGTVSAVQIETHRVGVRDTEENRRVFAGRLARALEGFLMEHLGFFGTGG